MQQVTRWGGALVRSMKAVSQIFKMDEFKIGADNCDTAQIVGNTALSADICEAHFRTVIGKKLDEVMIRQPEWKEKGYKENIRNMWNPNVDHFLRGLRHPHELIKCKPQLSITGGNNTSFAAWTDSVGSLGPNYNIENTLRSIAESEGHRVHDITIANVESWKKCFQWLKGVATQAGGAKKLNMTIVIFGMANDAHSFKKDDWTADQVKLYTDFKTLINGCDNC
jgi:hypothetical protein